jgi:hypothetical protein
MEHHTSMSVVSSEHQYLPHYMASHPRRQLCSESSMWKPQISVWNVHTFWKMFSKLLAVLYWWSKFPLESLLQSYKQLVHVLCTTYIKWMSNGKILHLPICMILHQNYKIDFSDIWYWAGWKSSTLKLWSNFSVGPLWSNGSFTLHEVKKKYLAILALYKKHW